MRFKNPSGHIADAARKIDALHPAVWSYKDTAKWGERPYVGLYADDVAKMDPRCAIRDENGDVTNYSDRCVEAYLVSAVNELHREQHANDDSLWHRIGVAMGLEW